MDRQYIPLSKLGTKAIHKRWHKSMIYYPSYGVYSWLNENIGGQWYQYGRAKHETVIVSSAGEYEAEIYFTDTEDKTLYELTWLNDDI